MSDRGIYEPCHMVGGMTAHYWEGDPRRLSFVLARYKHVARLLEGMGRVLELGCADGFGSRIVRQHVAQLHAIDLDAKSIGEACRNASPRWPIEFSVHDILERPLPGYDAVYCLDVLEHIDRVTEEQQFLENLRACAPVAVVGMPSLESQAYASALSQQGHINCKSGADLKATLKRHWEQVFLFGMNDETLHTGFPPMAHYLLALCVG